LSPEGVGKLFGQCAKMLDDMDSIDNLPIEIKAI
jgi:hypothetical protein